MSIQHVLRLRLPADTLVIGQRAVFGRSRNLIVRLEEWEVRKRLLALQADGSSMEALRRFWQPWQYDPTRINIANPRTLIDRVVPMTNRGVLLAYIAPTLGIDRTNCRGRARKAGEDIFGPGFDQNVFDIGPSAVTEHRNRIASLTGVERLALVVRRTTAHLNMSQREAYELHLRPEARTELIATLLSWTEEQEVGLGVVLEALLFGYGLVFLDARIAAAAQNIHKALELVADAHTAKDIDFAAQHFATALTIGGVKTVLAGIRRNTVPHPSPTTPQRPAPPQPPRQAPERFLMRSTSSSGAAASAGPAIQSPAAQAGALKDASKSGTPFVEQCS